MQPGLGARHVAESEGGAGLSAAISMLEIVSPSFYEGTPAAPLAEEWTQWLARYARRLTDDGSDDAERVAEMRSVSPKFIPREWMLAEAYTAAERGDHTVVQGLYELFRTPFDEHPAAEAKYYRRMPDTMRGKAGISYFS